MLRAFFQLSLCFESIEYEEDYKSNGHENLIALWIDQQIAQNYLALQSAIVIKAT